MLVWDGSFDLAVHVRSSAGRPRAVSCEVFGRREFADLSDGRRIGRLVEIPDGRVAREVTVGVP